VIISDELARQFASNLRVDVSDSNVLEVLKNCDSCDIWAAPGSGKTTIVATKVAILLEQWKSRAGILVLSHTNVAKAEVQQKLGQASASSATLQPPHFIGTIQAFVDAFLALPFLRAHDRCVSQIDDDAFASTADMLKPKVIPYNIQYSLSSRSNWRDIHRYLELVPRGAGKIQAGRRKMPTSTTATYKALEDLKSKISDRGIFRFSDMFHFAHSYLDENPNAILGIRARFPYVILDEAQDCDEMQLELLDRLFKADSVVFQRFGDENQAIFNADVELTLDHFPRDPKLPMGESFRFGPFIAGQISAIAPNRVRVVGRGEDPAGIDAPHTFFIFAEDSIEQVLPAFLKLAQSHFKERNNPIIKAVGYKKNVGASALPRAIGDYMSGDFNQFGDSPKDNLTFASLLLRARRIANRDGYPSGSRALLSAIRSWLIRWSDGNTAIATIRSMRSEPKTKARLGVIVLKLLKEPLTQNDYEGLLDNLKELFRPLLPPITSFAEKWTQWDSIDLLDRAFLQSEFETGVPETAELYGLSVETIHSVKGESHDATLVLETHHYKHDVSEVVALIAGTAAFPANPGKRLVDHLRRIFVAASRPRALLCFAVHKRGVTETILTGLKSTGWRVQVIEVEGAPVEE